MPRKLTLAYVAGLFDGEGCFGTSRSPRSGHNFLVSIANTFLPVLLQMQMDYGGKVYKRKKRQAHWKESYVWALAGRDGQRQFVEALLPHLVIKRQQAELFLAGLKLVQQPKSHYKFTKGELTARTAIAEAIQILNQGESKPEQVITRVEEEQLCLRFVL